LIVYLNGINFGGNLIWRMGKMEYWARN